MDLPRLASVAIKCHDLDAMVAFYRQVFGGDFRPPVTFGDMTCHFGRVGAATFKLVSGREAPPDVEGYPIHQLGLTVADVRATVALAQRHGGRAEGEVEEHQGQVSGCVRDPDGNTVELSQ